MCCAKGERLLSYPNNIVPFFCTIVFVEFTFNCSIKLKTFFTVSLSLKCNKNDLTSTLPEYICNVKDFHSIKQKTQLSDQLVKQLC